MRDSKRPPFGLLLRRTRLAAGLSQENLAERSSVSVQSISALERGTRRAPYGTTLTSLAEALAMAPEQREVFFETARPRRSPRRTPRTRVLGLPSFATSFFGRERECGEIRRLLRSARLVTVCGCGGIGKTRATVEVLSSLADIEPAIVFVDLVALHEPAQLTARIAASAGVEVSPRADASDLATVFGEQTILLVFDNCEHLVEACAQTAEALLRGCPNLRVLATTREPLLVDGEALYRLEPLDSSGAAVELFVDRATLAAPDSSIDPVVAATIARRLDGIPLAIELAAALARTQHPDAIAELLRRDPLPKEARRRTAVEHQRTMQDTLAWSYALLAERERMALRRLAAPDAGLTWQHAALLAGDLALVQRLVDVSLITEERATARVRLHETTRQFAHRLTPAYEMTELARRHATLLGAALQAAAENGWTEGTYAPLRFFGAELDNVRQLLRWSLESNERTAAQALLSSPDYWTAVGRAPEGFAWLTQAYERFGTGRGDAMDARLLFGLSMCAAQSGRSESAVEPAEQAGELASRNNLPIVAARSCIVLGNALVALGNPTAALERFAQALSRFEELDDATGLCRALTFSALAFLECERDCEAAQTMARAIELREARGMRLEPSERLLLDIIEIDLARFRGDRATWIARAQTAVASRGDGPLTSAHLRLMRQLVDGWIADGRLEDALEFGEREAMLLAERRFDTDASLMLERCALVLAKRGDTLGASRIAAGMHMILENSGHARSRSDRESWEALTALASEAAGNGAATVAEALALVAAARASASHRSPASALTH